MIIKGCPVMAFERCIGEDCQWWHEAFTRCAALSIAIGLTFVPAKKEEEDAGAIEISQEIMDKLKKAGIRTFSDIGKMGGISKLVADLVITPEEGEQVSIAFNQWKDLMSEQSSTPGEPGKS
jgi:hypothetical protein